MTRSKQCFGDPVEPSLLRFWPLLAAACAHIIGVSVSDTTAETRIVTPVSPQTHGTAGPTMSPMNSSGISTAISETVSETIVKPICSAPFSAASQRRLALFDDSG